MMQQKTGHSMVDSRKGVRRTVTILVGVVVTFFLLSFLQILLMK